MNMANKQDIPPILNILPEWGGPFLWIQREPDAFGVGSCLCDHDPWHESLPFSEGLWQKFTDWIGFVILLLVVGTICDGYDVLRYCPAEFLIRQEISEVMSDG